MWIDTFIQVLYNIVNTFIRCKQSGDNMQNKTTNKYSIAILRSKRKTISMTIRSDLVVEVRAPMHVSRTVIDEFINEHNNWIEKQMEKLRVSRQEAENAGILTREQLNDLADKAAEYIPKRAEYFSKIMDVSYGRITIRCQKTKWGSCSSKGNLNFNCLMMLMPADVTDYLIVHELCHRKEMNHSAKFWAEVEKVLPDYKTQEKWLKENGGRIMMRVKGF